MLSVFVFLLAGTLNFLFLIQLKSVAFIPIEICEVLIGKKIFFESGEVFGHLFYWIIHLYAINQLTNYGFKWAVAKPKND